MGFRRFGVALLFLAAAIAVCICRLYWAHVDTVPGVGTQAAPGGVAGGQIAPGAEAAGGQAASAQDAGGQVVSDGVADGQDAAQQWPQTGVSALQPGAVAAPITDGMSRVSVANCPLPLPKGTGGLHFCRDYNTELWRGASEAACADYARQLLLLLKDAGLELVQAGYLDLFGRSWGCVVKAADGTAYTLSVVGTSSAVDVTVVHTLLYPYEQTVEAN
jgi:hypothetical protein